MSEMGQECLPLTRSEAAMNDRPGDGQNREVTEPQREVARERSERDGGRDEACTGQDYPSVTFGDTFPSPGTAPLCHSRDISPAKRGNLPDKGRREERSQTGDFG